MPNQKIEMSGKFKAGQTVWTQGINAKIAEDALFAKFVLDCLKRHLNGDWGDLPKEDKEENELSLKENCRLLSAYIIPGTEDKIWIITEADRSVTTVLFPDEY